MTSQKRKRYYHSLRLLMMHGSSKRTAYLKKHRILGGIGENCRWGPWLIPPYAELIKLHDNVHVHKTAKLVTHDMLNGFLKTCKPDVDFGSKEKIGCIELMDNVYISMNVVVMPNVRINKNTIISAGSVVTSDIPENTIASGIPAQPVGKVDQFMALRRMGKANTPKFRNQQLPKEIADAEWARFYKRHDG